MNELEQIRQRMKEKRNLKTLGVKLKPLNNEKKSYKYINSLITRILISIIFFFGIIILTNSSTNNKKFFLENILSDNLPFSKISNIYNKYFGNIIPLNTGNDVSTVFNENIVYDNIEEHLDGYVLSVTNNYLVPIIESGIVVFNGEKEGYGNTIIIQGIDEIDYWYSNVQNTSVSLYDYVTKGTLLGTVEGTKLYLTFQNNGEYLGYNEVME